MVPRLLSEGIIVLQFPPSFPHLPESLLELRTDGSETGKTFLYSIFLYSIFVACIVSDVHLVTILSLEVKHCVGTLLSAHLLVTVMVSVIRHADELLAPLLRNIPSLSTPLEATPISQYLNDWVRNTITFIHVWYSALCCKGLLAKHSLCSLSLLSFSLSLFPSFSLCVCGCVGVQKAS